MINSNPYNQYRQTAIETASPEKLVLMLYDGAVKFITQAKIAMQEGKIEESNKALLKTQDIINELMASLNMDLGEVAVNLYNLYDYFRQRLIEANLKKNPEILDEVTSFLTDLRGAWAEAEVKVKTSGAVVNGMNVEV